MTRLLPVLLVLLLACGDDAPKNPAEAQQSYGAAVDATDAIPAPAVAAEAARYMGHRVTVDGRIAGVTQDGCALYLATDGGSPLRVDATRPDEGACAWMLPAGIEGFAVATGTLRVADDTLRLAANGVQVTPVQDSAADS